ncbi:MAG: PilZ domain-containing protein [Deltaproteobacteria bacterium]|nr:PilZ domain-containing protein [Deltaproteobacteria bacterium]MBI4926099.1 PilZ domain-containing protein [Bdellovibrio sp.]
MNFKEKRGAPRRKILDTFSFFMVIPKKGIYKLPLHDLSEIGLGFDFDIEGESHSDFPLSIGEEFEINFYLNQTLYLPLSIRVARIELRGNIRRAGAELQDKNSKNYKAFSSFVHTLDLLADAALSK